MRFSSLAAVAAAFGVAAGHPWSERRAETTETTDTTDTSEVSARCTNPLVRTEWRSLSTSQRTAYINAIKCLKSKPASSSYAGARSKFDDFLGLHIVMTPYIHWVGQFLPWHRYFMHLWETELRTSCGWKGGVPYWDWTLDATSAEAMLASPVFDPVTGFGGNGAWLADLSEFPSSWLLPVTIPDRTGGGCITNGPFANDTINMGPGNSTAYYPHCIRRDFVPSIFMSAGNSTRFAWAQEATDYWNFMRRVEGVALGIPNMSVHAAGHIGLGGMIGEMSNTYSSPGDPTFYLHHGQVDRAWDQWQRRNFTARKVDINGPDTQYGYPYNYYGDVAYKNITLDFVLDFGIWGTRKVREVMDSQNSLLCYKYAA